MTDGLDMAAPASGASDEDLSPLAWVHDELRRSLDSAHKALRRYLKDAQAARESDIDAVDPSVLRNARVQLHQGAGALELAGLPLAAHALRAGEALVQRFMNKPKTADAAAVDAVERLSFAVLDYVGRMLSRKPVAALELFPPYAAAKTLAGVDRVHPADLWAHDWQWRTLPDDPTAPEWQADETARAEMEALALGLIRQPDLRLLRAMSDLCAGLGAHAEGDRSTLWKIAAAFYEAQAAGLLTSDVYTKREASGLLAQLRAWVRGNGDVSDRLAQGLLFFCVRARKPLNPAQAPRLMALLSVWPHDAQAAVSYDTTRLGLVDPAQVAQARRRAATAKDHWSGLAAGELHLLNNLAESFALVGESIENLFPSGEALATALKGAAAGVISSGEAPPPALAMEVATSVLYLEAALEDGELDHPELGSRVRRLAARVRSVAAGEQPQALEPWMEELYRRVSDRQTLGSVVQELRASLAEAEKLIDQYFRTPTQHELLLPVPAQLASMRGVLSVLGLDDASQAVRHMQQVVDDLAQNPTDSREAALSGTFDRLADNLGALSFLIDMVSVQPHLARSLFRYDAPTGSLTAVVAQSARDSGVGKVTDDADVAHAFPAPTEFTPAAAPSAPAAPATGDLDDDAEMREIFLEEAREVLADADQSLTRLVADPADVAEMTALRRAFHTLKGSSRMVGLTEFGEAAWSCEQLYNARLGQSASMDDALQSLTRDALRYLTQWVSAIIDGRAAEFSATVLSHSADALRVDGRRAAVGESAAALPDDGDAAREETTSDADVASESAAAREALAELPALSLGAMVPNLPSESDLEFAPVERAHEGDVDPFAEPLAEGEVQAMPEVIDGFLDTQLEPAHGQEPEPMAAAVPDFGFELNLDDIGLDAAVPANMAEPVAEPVTEPVAEPEVVEPAPFVAEASAPELESIELAELGDEEASVADGATAPAVAPLTLDEQFKIIGDLRVPIPLFNIFLGEADEQARRLVVEVSEWALEPSRLVAESTIALAHSLAGNSATVGHADLSALARALEHALARSRSLGRGGRDETVLFARAAEEIRRLLHQFAAGFLQPVDAELLRDLVAHQHVEWRATAVPPASGSTTPSRSASQFAALDDADDDDIDAVDALDAELFPVFEDEADELLSQLRTRLLEWMRDPSSDGAAAACMRTLHTFKGGARLAGAMRVGEIAHRLESAVEQIDARDDVSAADIAPLLTRADNMASAFDQVREAAAAIPPPAPAPVAPAVRRVEPRRVDPARAAVTASAAPAAGDAIDWARFGAAAAAAIARDEAAQRSDGAVVNATAASVRVRVALLDRLVNEAGEISIARSRIDAETRAMQTSLSDLTLNLERLRGHLRDIELQAETQINTRLEAAKAASEDFDPLEMDRFTRFQELTRMMAESVNDVATVHRGLLRSLQSTEDELAAQTRLTRSLQDDLLRTRMVEFESLADRLYRVVRQTSKDTGKAVRLDIVGGSIEVDRGVLERMTGPFEHLLRNCVVHGIESGAKRKRAGKDGTGHITITVTHEGNEVGVAFGDDGGGLDLKRIRKLAQERGLIKPGAELDDAAVVQLIYEPGFSTAESVDENAGRGVGMDVVRSEVNAMGGRVETRTEAGKGTEVRLVLPLTTAVTQVVMLRVGAHRVAVPSTLMELVLHPSAAETRQALADATLRHGDGMVPFYAFGTLLQDVAPTLEDDAPRPVVVVRSAARRVALLVDEVLGNQEVVVKNLGPQLAHLPGIAGITLLASGAVALIYNPVALAAFYGNEALARAQRGEAGRAVQAVPLAPLVMVVDDSLTVRRVTQRLLVREGYRVKLAKDGKEALDRLAEERPAVLLSDIEMPRMDGFELVRHVRADAGLAGMPIIMITSRIAQKHRDYAAELGVDHYLGKPFAEDALLALLTRYTTNASVH